MNKFLISLMIVALPLCANAQERYYFGKSRMPINHNETEYMVGAFPMENGKVIFRETIEAPGKTKEQIFNALRQWASLRYMADSESGLWTDRNYFKNLSLAKVESANESTGEIVCNAEEEMVFSSKALSKDFTKLYYKLNIKCEDGKASFTLSNIKYIYEGASDPSILPAEEWITDEEALNKKKTKFIRISGKFRVKTIDLVENLKDQMAKKINE